MEENKDSNSKRKFIKKLIKSAAGVVLLPVVGNAEGLGEQPNASPSPSPSPFMWNSITPSPSLSPTPSFSPSNTATPSMSPSNTATPSLSPSASMTPSVTPTATASTTPSGTPLLTPTASTSVTPSTTPSALPTSSTPTPTPSPSTIVNGVEEMLKANGIEVGTFNPNPTSDRSFVVVVAKQSVNVNVDVFDISSRNVFSRSYSLRSGSNSLEVELPSGPPSFYQVLIDFGGKVVSRRLMTK